MWRGRRTRNWRLLFSKFIEPFGGVDQGAAGMVGALPLTAALPVIGGGTIRGASGPPSAFFGDLEFFAEIERLGEGAIIFFVAGEAIHFQHAEERFVLNPPGFFGVIGGLIERPAAVETAMRVVVAE